MMKKLTSWILLCVGNCACDDTSGQQAFPIRNLTVEISDGEPAHIDCDASISIDVAGQPESMLRLFVFCPGLDTPKIDWAFTRAAVLQMKEPGGFAGQPLPADLITYHGADSVVHRGLKAIAIVGVDSELQFLLSFGEPYFLPEEPVRENLPPEATISTSGRWGKLTCSMNDVWIPTSDPLCMNARAEFGLANYSNVDL